MIKQSLLTAGTFVFILLLQACSATSGSASLLSSEMIITPSPSSSTSVGGTITLSVTDESGTTSDPTFTFTAEPATTGVTVTPSGSSSATVFSSIAATVTIMVTEYATGSSTITNSNSITLYFGTSAIGTTTGSTLVGSNGSLSVYASPSSTAAVGTPITLSASSTLGTGSYTFSPTFAQAGVTVTPIGTTEATVTSTIATTVTLTVTSFGTTTTASEVPVTLTFGGAYGIGTSTGAVEITASPSPTAALGTPITLTAFAPGVTNPVYSFTQLYTSVSGASVIPTGTGAAEVTSTIATSITIEVTATSATYGVAAQTGEITLTFGSTTGYPGGYPTTGTLVCNLNFTPQAYYIDSSITFYIGEIPYLLEATDGEPLIISNFSPGEQWDNAPSATYSSPITGFYDYAGWKTVSMTAYSSVTGLPCNGGGQLTGQVYINP
jgi:hypothetical protein